MPANTSKRGWTPEVPAPTSRKIKSSKNYSQPPQKINTNGCRSPKNFLQEQGDRDQVSSVEKDGSIN